MDRHPSDDMLGFAFRRSSAVDLPQEYEPVAKVGSPTGRMGSVVTR